MGVFQVKFECNLKEFREPLCKQKKQCKNCNLRLFFVFVKNCDKCLETVFLNCKKMLKLLIFAFKKILKHKNCDKMLKNCIFKLRQNA